MQCSVCASPYQKKLDKVEEKLHSTFHPKFLEDLETNISNSENDDMELEISELAEDNNEELKYILKVFHSTILL